MYRQAKSSSTKRNITIASVCILILLIVSAGSWAAWKNSRHTDSSPTSSTSSNPDIDLSPATPEQQEQSNKFKEESVETPPSNPQSHAVTPVIVDASQYDSDIEVRSNIPGIVEDGGTCTILFTKGSTKITKQVTAVADARTTRCNNLTIERSTLTAGSWTVTVSYSSNNASGTSAAVNLVVR